MKWKLSRKGKILRNFALTLVCLFFVWAYYDYPLPGNTLNFRRAERQNMAPHSQIMFSAGEKDSWEDPASESSISNTRPTVIGVGEDWITAATGYSRGDWMLYTFPRQEEGVDVIPLPMGLVSYWSDEGFQGFRIPMVLLNVPEWAVRGDLTLEMDYRGFYYHCSAPLCDAGNGVWLAAMETPESGWSDDWGCEADYTLRLYDQKNDLLLEQVGVTPLHN